MFVLFLFSLCYCGSAGANLFHEESSILITPPRPAKYFGYSLIIRNFSTPQLVVGAPGAPSTHEAHRGLGNTGAIYRCDLDTSTRPDHIACPSYEFDTSGNIKQTSARGQGLNHYKNEMWLGGALADVNGSSLIMCAPRWCNEILLNRKPHRLVNGLCYVNSHDSTKLLVPLVDLTKQAFRTMGASGVVYLNYFAYGQVGFSAAVSADQNWLLLGAPGVMQWTGDVVKYVNVAKYMIEKDAFVKQTIANTHYTEVLQEDSYFGYAVDTGVFEKDGETLGVGGAPRGHGNLGQVLIFELTEGAENSPMRVRATLTGGQLGEYFGSALLVADLNADGRDDLLVGAPLHVDKSGDTARYDQGIVYVYLNRPKNGGFWLELVTKLVGSGSSGARFGSSLAQLGDVDDSDELPYPEIAVGAPWEEDGRGAVYVYRSSAAGVISAPAQRLSPGDSGFGYSITRGIDIDGNGCNDVVVGAAAAGAARLYLCSRSVRVAAHIRLPGALNLPENSTGFSAEFCVVAAPTKQRDRRGRHVSIGLSVEISVDVGSGRASFESEENELRYQEPSVSPGNTYCKEMQVTLQEIADLSRPIPVTMTVSASSGYPPKDRSLGPGERLSDSSQLSDSVEIRLTRDCGEDFICEPEFHLDVAAFSSKFVPGSTERFGVTIDVSNSGETSYSGCVEVRLPRAPVRVPADCRLGGVTQGGVIQCSLPQPLLRRARVRWDIDLDSSPALERQDAAIHTTLFDSCRTEHGKKHAENSLVIQVRPESNISVIGNVLQEEPVNISRESLDEGRDINIGHYFTIVNNGPSELSALEVHISFPSQVNLTHEVSGCARAADNATLSCVWRVPVSREKTVKLIYAFPLAQQGELLEDGPFVLTTTLYTSHDESRVNVSSTLVAAPRSPLWPLCVAALLGLLLFALITYSLYRVGFFGRLHRDRLQRLKHELARGRSVASDSNDALIGASETDLDRPPSSREPSPLSDIYSVCSD